MGNDEAHFHHIFNTNVLGLLTTTKVAVANFNSARAEARPGHPSDLTRIIRDS